MPDAAPSVRPPDRPGQAPFRRPDRRPGPGRRARDAQGHRLHRRGPRQAAHRRRRRPGSRRCRATTTSAGWPSTSRTGIRAAGGTPMEFNTISVSDGVTMGTEGMKASLVSREVVADSIELVVRGHLFDGARLPRRLRQDDARRGDGAGPPRRARPRSSTTARSTRAPTRASATRRRDASTRRSARTGPARSRSTSCTRSRTRPARARAPAAASTRPTRCAWCSSSSASRRPASTASRPRIRPRTRPPARPASSSWTSSGATSGRRRSSPATRSRTRSPSVAATGGSTNGVLHLLAIAHEFGIPLDIDEFGAIADRTPIVADMQPGGRFTASRPVRRGRRRRWSCASCSSGGLLHGDAPTVDGRTIAEIAARRDGDAGPAGRRADRDAAQADRRPGDPARHRSRPTAAS